jgi:membrane fusion protein, copper/silver efflux system
MKTFGANRVVLICIATVTLGFVLGFWMRGESPRQKDEPAVESLSTKAEPADKHLMYVCPMMCVPPMEKAGNCPICGMELIPIAGGTEQHEGEPTQLKLSEEAIRLAEIRLAPVERKFVSAEVRLFGQIDFDPSHVTNITAFMPGVINRVYVKRAGQFVRWGDPLFDIHSSDLLQTQQELIQALKYVSGFYAFQGDRPHVAREVPIDQPRTKAPTNPDERSPEVVAAYKTVEAIRHKLQILGLPKRDIDALMKKGEATGIATVYAPMYGQVTDQQAFEGTFVNTGTTIFTLADPMYVWAKLDAYEFDYAWIRKGQRVIFQTDAYPGEIFEAKVVYIDPVFYPKTRTFTVGAIISDHGGRLKAGMLIRAVISAQLTSDGKVVNEGTREKSAPLVIPDTAPLITGKRAVVYVACEEGMFEGREVMLGPKAKDSYVVLEGLEEGEQVVINGNFKIDSAVQILARSSMLGIKGGHSAMEHNRPGDSDAMHQDYWHERMESRSSSFQASDVESMEQPEKDKAQTSIRSTINRRRPGMYGDTSRPVPDRQNW